MKHNANSLKTYLIFAPVFFISLAIILLGALFVQGYDVGNAMPRLSDGGFVTSEPQVTPSVNAIEIADTSHLPTSMPAVPTPARQVTTHSMKHKEPSALQPDRPLRPVAEAATSGQRPVSDAVHQAVELQQQNKTQDPPSPAPAPVPPVDNSAPVPEIPAPVTPPLVQ